MADIFEQLKESLSPSYFLEREIGRGGMVTVYLARDINRDRDLKPEGGEMTVYVASSLNRAPLLFPRATH